MSGSVGPTVLIVEDERRPAGSLSERVAITTQRDRRQLEASREFAELESRLDRLGAREDQQVDGFDENDFVALLHDSPAERGY